MNPLLLIVGSAPCLQKDLQNPLILSLSKDAFDLLAVGLAAVDKTNWPLKYVATYHPAEIPMIRERREKLIGRVDFEIISHERHDYVAMFVNDWWKPSGSSALLGVQAALAMNYRRIILAGCPLTGANAQGGAYEVFRIGWEDKKKVLSANVRSLSGWTRELLGAPTEEWLND